MGTIKKILVLMLGVAICLSSSIATAAVTYSGQAEAPENKLVLWYRQPAVNWMTSSLPIGNGRL